MLDGKNSFVISVAGGSYNFPVRNRVGVNVYAFKMAASIFKAKNIRS